MSGITYKDAGVDIHKAERLLWDIKKNIQSTFNPFVMNSVGGFAALTEIPTGYNNPVMVSSTDGVGTKLKIAFMSGKHDTVGIDLVAMSVNDVLTMGAKPYYFLDYFASGRIDNITYKNVIAGICEGCRIAGCALIGGETAEMPSFYEDGEYDLAGFAIGFVEKDRIINGSSTEEGDVVIGLASNGIHSNGYSLVRKVLLELHNLNIFDTAEEIEGALWEELLRPTRIYVTPVLNILDRFTVKGMAHITGGGLPGNIGRIVPDGLTVMMNMDKGKVPNIFKLIMKLGEVTFEEMCSTFNMGVGYVCIVKGDQASGVLETLNAMGESAFAIGHIEKSCSESKVLINS